MNNNFRVTSLGSICTSTAKHVPNEYNEVREQKFTNLREYNHLLDSFYTKMTTIMKIDDVTVMMTMRRIIIGKNNAQIVFFFKQWGQNSYPNLTGKHYKRS
jgi:hypothetical protein